MPGLPVPFMLTVAILTVMLMIVSTLDLLEGISDLFFVCLIRRKPESLIAVPIDVLLRTLLIDVVTVPDIEAAVIVFRIVSPMLAGSAIVPCHLHRQLLLS